MIVILSYFHVRIGPIIFFSYPKTQLDNEISIRVYEIMNQPEREEFFTQSFGNLKLLNYYFKVPSDWARGSTELCMLTILVNQEISPEIEMIISSSCEEFSEKIQSNEYIFTGFYINDLNDLDDEKKERIKKNELLIKDLVKDLYWEMLQDIRKKSEEQKVTLLLNDQYIFESLGLMSKELKKISTEISSNESSLKGNSIIKNSISNLNKIIDDLNEEYMEKMTKIDIEIETDFISSTEEELDTNIQKSKKELKKVLKGEIKEEKE